jgi:branched-chain amino acid transport system substrate-binding protein
VETDVVNLSSPIRRWVALLGLALVAGCESDAGTVKLGIAGPFTDPIGAPMLRAAELAVDEINRAGGIDGRRVELLALDDHGNADSAIAVATRLYDSDVSAVVGHLFSSTTIAAAPVYNAPPRPVVAISPSSSAPEISGAGDWIFRVCPSDGAHGLALARWAREQLGLQRGTAFYLNDDYGRGVRQTFASEFVRRGGELLAANPYLGDRPEIAPYVERLARDPRSQFVLLAGNRSEAEVILREAAQHGVRLPAMGGDGLEGIEAAGDLAEGVYLTAAYVASIGTPENTRFVTAYRRMYPDAPLPNQPAAATYDAVRLLVEVIGRAGTGREAVRAELAKVGVETPAFTGVTGEIAFDERGDVPGKKVYVTMVRDGNIVLAGGQ